MKLLISRFKIRAVPERVKSVGERGHARVQGEAEYGRYGGVPLTAFMTLRWRIFSELLLISFREKIYTFCPLFCPWQNRERYLPHLRVFSNIHSMPVESETIFFP